MAFEFLNLHGAVSGVIMAIIIGVVVLFVGIFTLSAVEPMFAGRIQECTFGDTAPSAAITLNGTAADETTANMTFASLTNAAGDCDLIINVSNVSAPSGATVLVRQALSEALLATITTPVISQQYNVSGVTSQASGNWLVNITATGSGNVTIPTGGTYLRCCSSVVSQRGPAGQHYAALVTLTGTIFTVCGLVIIVIGLAAAVGSLKTTFS